LNFSLPCLTPQALGRREETHAPPITAMNSDPSPPLSSVSSGRAAPPALSARETKVLHWLAQGHTKAEVGEILCISRHTVDFHVRNIAAKLGARNLAAAVYRAVGAGLLPTHASTCSATPTCKSQPTLNPCQE
jgi:DNA-binding CsgD family transcriptional regulator